MILLDTLLKIIWFLLWASICWALLYGFSPYNPNKPNAKYITVNNKIISKLLIPKRNPFLKYVKVKDRNKLSLKCFVGYIILALIIIASLIMAFLPPIPCEPTILPAGRRSRFIVSTYNEKIPLSLISVFALSILLYVLIPITFNLFTKKDDSVKMGSKLFMIFIILLLLFATGYLLVNLI